MTLLFTVNQTPATAAVAIYLLKTQLKAAGWTIPRSSDGTVYNSSGDQISSGASGAGGMDNNRAWFVVQQPGCLRSFCLQRHDTVGADTSREWRVKYSKGAGFTGGSPAATVTPSATDEIILVGSGTDAAPGFGLLFAPVGGDGLFRFNCFASNTPPYGFLSWGWQNSSGSTCHAFGLEPVVGANMGDTDPWVLHAYNLGTLGNSWAKLQFRYGGNQVHAWMNTVFYFCSGSVPAFSTSVIAPYLSSGYDLWKGCMTNAFSANDDALPLVGFAFNNTTGPYFLYKGTLGYCRAIGQPGRSTGSLYSLISTNDTLLINDVLIPWDGISVPLI